MGNLLYFMRMYSNILLSAPPEKFTAIGIDTRGISTPDTVIMV
jgi:hypothetical protein